MKRILLLLCFATAAGATNRTWTGLGSDANWSTNANWNPSGAIGSGDNLTFDNTCTNCNSTVDTNVTVNQLTLSSTYTGTLTNGNTLAVTSQLIFQGGTLAFTGGTFNIAGDIFCGVNLKTASNASALNDIAAANSNLTVHSGCTVSLDSLITNSNIIVSSGGIVNSPANPQLAILNNGGTFNGNGSLTITQTLINGAGATMNLTGLTVTINGNGVDIFCGSPLQSATGYAAMVVNIASLMTVNGNCTGVVITTWTAGGLKITSGGGATLPSSATVSSINNAGTLTATNITDTGDWVNTGTFNNNSGTVTFSDTDHNILGPTTFYNFVMQTAAAARTLTFSAANTTTISNSLTMLGLSGKLLLLRSQSSGNTWTIIPNGTKNVGFVDVKDSTNSAAAPIYAGTHSTNSGNNTNWIFTDPPANVPRHNSGFIME